MVKNNHPNLHKFPGIGFHSTKESKESLHYGVNSQIGTLKKLMNLFILSYF